MTPALPQVPLSGRTAERELLAEASQRSTLPQTLLLSGASGTGKRRLALWIAQMILCADSSSQGPCGECTDCRLAAKIEHPDLHLYLPHGPVESGSIEQRMDRVETVQEKARATMRASALYPSPETAAGYYVATVRVIAAHARTRPYRDGGRAVFILSDADRMENAVEAQNALLKLLEEPPAHAVFILTASAPHRLLDTIRSRTADLSLTPLKGSELEQILQNGGISPEEAQRVVPEADGSVQRALQLLDPQWQASREEAWAHLAACMEGNVAERLRYVASLEHGGAGALLPLMDHLQELAYTGAELATGRAPATASRALRTLHEQGGTPTVRVWVAVLEAIVATRRALEANGSPQLHIHRLLRRISLLCANELADQSPRT